MGCSSLDPHLRFRFLFLLQHSPPNLVQASVATSSKPAPPNPTIAPGGSFGRPPTTHVWGRFFQVTQSPECFETPLQGVNLITYTSSCKSIFLGGKQTRRFLSPQRGSINLVDLENPSKMSLWSLLWLSIQRRTSLSKFEGDFIHFFILLPRFTRSPQSSRTTSTWP